MKRQSHDGNSALAPLPSAQKRGSSNELVLRANYCEVGMPSRHPLCFGWSVDATGHPRLDCVDIKIVAPSLMREDWCGQTHQRDVSAQGEANASHRVAACDSHSSREAGNGNTLRYISLVSNASSFVYPHIDPRETPMNVLALDLGTCTGWALHTADGGTVSGSESFKPGRFEGGGMRYLRFKRWLTEIKATAEPLGAVYFEEVRRHAGVDAAHAYGGFLGVLTAWCEHHAIPYSGVPVGTIKRSATGKGNASKAQVIEAMRALGHQPANDNEADALALLTLAACMATESGSDAATRAAVPTN